MGNDGGSIPTRRELVKEAARTKTTTELKESQHEQQEYYWNTDPLSRKPLAQPVVSDCNGKLYNKDSIIEFLLPSDDDTGKAEAEKILQGAVKSLKDVVEVKFEVDMSDDLHKNISQRRERWICPITRDPLGPGSKAVYLVPCGHAFAGSVTKEITENSVKEGERRRCLQCCTEYAENDVIPLLPTSKGDVTRLLLRMETLREKGLTHSLREAKKRKKSKRDKTNGESSKTKDVKAETDKVPENKKRKIEKSNGNSSLANGSKTNGIKSASATSVNAKVSKDIEAKRRKIDANENLKSLFSSSDPKKLGDKSRDFMTRGFTIPADAKR